VFGLCGTLGAGKTTFVKGLARGLGVDEDRRVISPTFVLMRSYPGRLMLYHFDAYRLSGGEEMEAIGAAEAFASGGVAVVEWADHVAECLPQEHFLLHLTVEGRDRRRFKLEAVGPGPRARLASLANALGEWRVTPAS
jgi:tRNA threonylcarbamoyladenosine biosynthesis protein TsaE